MSDSSALRDKLSHPDKNVRLDAAMSLGTTHDARDVPVLATRLPDEPDFFVRETIVWALVRIGSAAVEPMIALLAHADPATRTQAAHALSKLGDRRAAPALLAALGETSEAVVQKSVYALGVLREISTLPALLALLDQQRTSLEPALHDALAAFGGAALPPLIERLASADADAATRVAIIEVLSASGEDAAHQALCTALRDGHWRVRFAAVHGLSNSTSPDLGSWLRPLEGDEHPHVRTLATRVLARRR